MRLKEALLWGVALAAFLTVVRLLGPEQGHEFEMLMSVLIVIGIIGWRIWKGR
jgi:hypothetical protein